MDPIDSWLEWVDQRISEEYEPSLVRLEALVEELGLRPHEIVVWSALLRVPTASGACYSGQIPDLAGYPVLHPKETALLVVEGSETSKEFAWRGNLRLAAKISIFYRNSAPIPLADLFQEASLGLRRAVDKFDPSRGNSFTTYAMAVMKFGLYRVFDQDSQLVRASVNARRLVRRRLNGAQLEPREKKLADKAASTCFPLNVLAEDGRWKDFGHTTDAPAPDQVAQDREQLVRFREIFERLCEDITPRDRAIVKERLLSDNSRTLEDISKEHGLSRERIRQIEQKFRDELTAVVREELG